jgi:hypothetical protein
MLTPARTDRISELTSKAESCFAIACAEQDAGRRRQFTDWALYWFRCAERANGWRDGAREGVPSLHPFHRGA